MPAQPRFGPILTHPEVLTVAHTARLMQECPPSLGIYFWWYAITAKALDLDFADNSTLNCWGLIHTPLLSEELRVELVATYDELVKDGRDPMSVRFGFSLGQDNKHRVHLMLRKVGEPIYSSEPRLQSSIEWERTLDTPFVIKGREYNSGTAVVEAGSGESDIVALINGRLPESSMFAEEDTVEGQAYNLFRACDRLRALAEPAGDVKMLALLRQRFPYQAFDEEKLDVVKTIELEFLDQYRNCLFVPRSDFLEMKLAVLKLLQTYVDQNSMGSEWESASETEQDSGNASENGEHPEEFTPADNPGVPNVSNRTEVRLVETLHRVFSLVPVLLRQLRGGVLLFFTDLYDTLKAFGLYCLDVVSLCYNWVEIFVRTFFGIVLGDIQAAITAVMPTGFQVWTILEVASYLLRTVCLVVAFGASFGMLVMTCLGMGGSWQVVVNVTMVVALAIFWLADLVKKKQEAWRNNVARVAEAGNE